MSGPGVALGPDFAEVCGGGGEAVAGGDSVRVGRFPAERPKRERRAGEGSPRNGRTAG